MKPGGLYRRDPYCNQGASLIRPNLVGMVSVHSLDMAAIVCIGAQLSMSLARELRLRAVISVSYRD